MPPKTKVGKKILVEAASKSDLSMRVESVPKHNQFEEHKWADYVELLCLCSIDGEISRSDITDRIRLHTEDLKEGSDDLQNEDGELPASINDKWTERVNNWFRHIHYRIGSFAEVYPFELSDSNKSLKRKQNLSDSQKLYVYLLLSANLGFISKHHALTQSFEVVSFEVLKRSLPASAEVYVFGTSPLLPRRYEGNLWARINKLAGDLKEKVVAREVDFATTDVGDGGLDLVAWIPSGDDLSSRLIVFGQCACTDEWVTKQTSSSPEVWRGKIHFSATPYNMVCIPHCLRNADGTWHTGSNIRCIMIDRHRIVHFIKEKLEFFVKLPAMGIVNEVLADKAPVV